MRCTSTILMMIVAAAAFAPAVDAAVVDFENLQLPDDSAAPDDPTQTPFESSGANFNRTWSTEFNCCPGAWNYSNKKDLTTAGFMNPYSAYALPNGGGFDGSSNFAVANNLVQGEATVVLPGPSRVLGTYVTNTTYGYLAAVDGNDGGAGFVKGPFADGDWFRVDFVGIDEQDQEVGSVPFFLVDFQDGKSDAVTDWTWVDLSGLGDRVKRLEFRMDSTDQGQFGMSTPAYFAVDNLTYQIVPEPSAMTGTCLAMLVVLSQVNRVRPHRRRRRPVA